MIPRLPFTLALSAMVESATERKVGRGRKPEDTDPPYYLQYAMPVVRSGAPFTDLNEDASFVYQFTCVSGPDPDHPGGYGLADQTEFLADRLNTAILGRDPATGLWLHNITAPGCKVIGRSSDVEAGGTSDPGDAIMSYVLRYRFDLTSA
ncbi:hypothetical protein ACFQ6Q_00420 [Streptomyces sp. NPDC056437]|uniref:hypothetical protein n=1 Tax=Streptomyces sp. NPDC056437 TaxID=3345816 RepID=UPI003689D9A9